MKTLFVMRHAKSSWDDPNWSDFERPLNARGLAAARLMGGLMSERAMTPARVVSSPATRARQTAEIVVESAGLGVPVIFEERIYEASALTLFNIVRGLPDASDAVLLVGHSPGFEQLVYRLTGKPVVMPTAALAEIRLEIESWTDVATEVNELREFLTPKGLA